MENVFKKINIRKKIFFNIFWAVIFLFALSYFIILPDYRELKKISAETEDIKKNMEAQCEGMISQKNLIKDYQEAKSQIHLLDSFFIKKEDSDNFVDSLEELALKNNVRQNASLLTEGAIQKNFYSRVPLRISASGSVDDILNYLRDLEEFSYYLSISKVEISENNIKSVSGRNITESIEAGQSILVLADTFWLE